VAVRKFKPTSDGRRFMTVSDFAEITRREPERSLLAPLPKKGGRNNRGRITVRHQGGGHKRKYRIIDFRRDKWGVPGRIAEILGESRHAHLQRDLTGEARFRIKRLETLQDELSLDVVPLDHARSLRHAHPCLHATNWIAD